jgi:hypothetical protein
MQNEARQEDAAASGVDPARPLVAGTPLSRRQAIGRLSALATAGAAAWVVPEILTAKPAGGATLSVVTSPSTAPSQPSTNSGDGPASSPASSLAYTGLNIERDTEIGAALIAGGWAMHHWASRTATPGPMPRPTPRSTPPAEGPSASS